MCLFGEWIFIPRHSKGRATSMMTSNVLAIYKKQIQEQDSLIQEVASKRENGDAGLRFDLATVSASSVGQQWFCEKKVEMRYLHGEVETEAKQVGIEAHDLLLADSVRVEREEIFQRIHLGEDILVREMHLLSKHNNVIIVGRPDAIFFFQSMPYMLFEYKFSRSPNPQDSYHNQAKVYCKILQNMGFDISQLHYALVVIHPTLRSNEELREKVTNMIIANGPKEARLEEGGANIYIYPYNPDDANRNIDWALDYWRKTREAVPTRNPYKCRSCEYKAECPSSLS
jgi:hypothetical protein